MIFLKYLFGIVFFIVFFAIHFALRIVSCILVCLHCNTNDKFAAGDNDANSSSRANTGAAVQMCCNCIGRIFIVVAYITFGVSFFFMWLAAELFIALFPSMAEPVNDYQAHYYSTAAVLGDLSPSPPIRYTYTTSYN